METEHFSGMSESDSEASEDDPVVREIPIYNSHRLKNQIYLVQYPLKTDESQNDTRLRRCFFKETTQELKMEMEYNTQSANFDEMRAENIAREVDGPPEYRKSNKDVFFENNIADKIVYNSQKSVKEPGKYAVAAFNGKELHLTPLAGVLEMRPSFTFLDKIKHQKAQQDGNSDEEAGPSTSQQVTVKFKQNDDRWKKSKENQKSSLSGGNENWVEYEWFDQDSTKSNIARLKFMAESLQETHQACGMSLQEYLRILVPPDEEELTTKPTLPSHLMSLHALRALPLLEQCKLLMKDAQIIQFQQILMLLAGGAGITADNLLKTLPKVAVLVRGNWVVKSEILYPPETMSATSGVPAELMCRARDYVLYLFTKNQYVERKKISSVTKIPAEEVKEIFMGISKLKHNNGWELTLPNDHDFVNKHAELVQRQNLLWEERVAQLSDFNQDRKRRKSKSFSESGGKSRDNPNYTSSDNESGTEKNKSPVVARRNKSTKIVVDGSELVT